MPTKYVRRLAADGEERRLKLGFTSKNAREGRKFDVGPLAIQIGGPPEELVGWDWQRLSPANSPVETLVVENEAMVYETSQYTSWETLKARYDEVALPTLDAILQVSDVLAISLEYVDRFVFDGEPSEARPDLLLPEISTLLHPDAASGRELWHLHRGWFEEADGRRLLINQNFDAQDGRREDGSTFRSVQMFTKTELRPKSDEFDIEALTPHLQVMHDRSIDVFKSPITPEMYAQVGLSESADD